jgi:hypothetical protein
MRADVAMAYFVLMQIFRSFQQLETQSFELFLRPRSFVHFFEGDELAQCCVAVISNDDQTFIIIVFVNARLDDKRILVDKSMAIVLLL